MPAHASGSGCFSVDHQWPPLPLFSQVFILKGVKVICFDTLLQVLILRHLDLALWRPTIDRFIPRKEMVRAAEGLPQASS